VKREFCTTLQLFCHSIKPRYAEHELLCFVCLVYFDVGFLFIFPFSFNLHSHEDYATKNCSHKKLVIYLIVAIKLIGTLWDAQLQRFLCKCLIQAPGSIMVITVTAYGLQQRAGWLHRRIFPLYSTK
jgi:hypothetical protein